MCVCVCVSFFFVKDFSRTTEPRILKFGTNVGYNLLYCVRENQPPPLIISIICPFFFYSKKIPVTDFSASMRAKVFKVCIHLESGQLYCGKENQDAEINFCLLFPVLLFSISHSNVIHREIVSKISQEQLHLEFWNLVQMLGMTCCIV